MLLKQTGLKHPLAVIFTGIACGICLTQDKTALAFCVIMLVLLFSLKRLPHLVLGIGAGLLVCLLIPQTVWLDGEHSITGQVKSARFEMGVFRVLLDHIQVNGHSVYGLARLNVYKIDKLTTIDQDTFTGGNLSSRVDLSPPRPFGNTGEFDYARNLRSQKITVIGSIKDADSIHTSSSKGFGINFHAIVKPAGNILSKLARPEAEILKAILWGDRSGLSYAVQDGFASLGLSHLIAISGLNIGLMVLFGYVLAYTVIRAIPWLAMRLDTPLIAKIAGLFIAVMFALIVEASYPTTRSTIMTLIVITAFIFARRTDLIDALALSGCIILLIWPLSLFTASFLLSFSAVFGLIVTLERLKGTPVVIQYVAVPVAASAFTLPIAVYAFGFIAPLSILYNLVFVPIFSFMVMPFGLLGMCLGLLWEQAATLCFGCAMDIVHWILWTGAHLGRLVPVPRPPVAWVFLCYLGLILAFFARHESQDRSKQYYQLLYIRAGKAALIVICFLLIVLPIGQHIIRMRQPLTFDFISVGQGDCTLITKESHAILIDAGGMLSGFDTGRLIVAPHLLRRGITRLDLAVLTHSHPDHAGGMRFMIQRFDIGTIWTNVTYDPGFQDVIRIASLKSIPVRNVCRGDSLKINDLKINVLHPQICHDKSTDVDLNLHSLVLKIGDGGMTGLFMADAYKFGELTLAHSEQDLQADILKVAHHGSSQSCQDVFLDVVRPLIAVIPCGYTNRYGMPAPDVLDRLSSRHIQVYRTDMNGEVQISREHGRTTVKSNVVCAEMD